MHRRGRRAPPGPSPPPTPGAPAARSGRRPRRPTRRLRRGRAAASAAVVDPRPREPVPRPIQTGQSSSGRAAHSSPVELPVNTAASVSRAQASCTVPSSPTARSPASTKPAKTSGVPRVVGGAGAQVRGGVLAARPLVAAAQRHLDHLVRVAAVSAASAGWRAQRRLDEDERSRRGPAAPARAGCRPRRRASDRRSGGRTSPRPRRAARRPRPSRSSPRPADSCASRRVRAGRARSGGTHRRGRLRSAARRHA